MSCSSAWPSIRAWQRYRELLVVAALVLVPLGLYITQGRRPDEPTLPMRIFAFVSGPIEAGLSAGLGGIGNAWQRYIALQGVEGENDKLRAVVGRLTAQNARLHEELKQMEDLRKLVHVIERPSDVHYLHAQVVATSPVALFRSVRIDRGSNDGLQLGAAVVAYEGVVGRIAALYADAADVMLLTDANSSADVLVQRTRARARVRGQGRDDDFAFDAQYLSRQAEVEPGDLLVTSGAGRTFPKGLSVGRVMGVERRAFGLYQRAVVQPSVDFTRLEHVLVVTAMTPNALESTP